MPALRLSIPAAELGRRVKERLRGDPPNPSTRVVWQRDNESLLVNTDSVTVRLVDGWLLCNVDLQTDQTGRQTLQFVYFLGKAADSDGLQAACSINAPTPGASQLAAAWGGEVQRVLWDAVLDAIELMVYHAESVQRGAPVTLGGFHCTAEAIVVDVIAGAR